jgi:hypothetical protein
MYIIDVHQCYQQSITFKQSMQFIITTDDRRQHK